MLGVHARPDVDLTSTLMGPKAFDMILPVLLPMAAGSVPLGLAAGLVSYFVVKSAVAAYQLRRREQLEARIMARNLPDQVEGEE
jgi:uncharacterized protein (DUF2062 family)